MISSYAPSRQPVSTAAAGYSRGSTMNAIQNVLQPPQQVNPLLAELSERREEALYRNRRPLGRMGQRATELMSNIPDPDARFGRPTPKPESQITELLHPSVEGADPQPLQRRAGSSGVHAGAGQQLSRRYEGFDKEAAYGVPVADVDWSGSKTKHSLAWAEPDRHMETTSQALGKAVLRGHTALGSSDGARHHNSAAAARASCRQNADRDHRDILTWSGTSNGTTDARKPDQSRTWASSRNHELPPAGSRPRGDIVPPPLEATTLTNADINALVSSNVWAAAAKGRTLWPSTGSVSAMGHSGAATHGGSVRPQNQGRPPARVRRDGLDH
ncbi:hypothetical protein H9P43_001526 [Blastocladiella emersonii ATCC 22665]|nr:hypothetical protein H9P43_001526 [Blastocladiella emersonii ATCC 22665]